MEQRHKRVIFPGICSFIASKRAWVYMARSRVRGWDGAARGDVWTNEVICAACRGWVMAWRGVAWLGVVVLGVPPPPCHSEGHCGVGLLRTYRSKS